jgi:hypothetical protein
MKHNIIRYGMIVLLATLSRFSSAGQPAPRAGAAGDAHA